MVMGVIEGDWLKVEKNPEAYEDALERLREEQSEGARINIDFFRDFESPVHPKYSTSWTACKTFGSRA
eukprot:CAMPEP_0170471576 /NCGR_PEP_ID=MMETSP0123-20130129/13752_1 /TAXON_ID=182087 /ORGANISM="Favella ehrenbergii, Strain Fehren 1" /LENGTH=67 /DNA_ID=CAMNT_0010739275 /DNA_START=573 /DNA_END=776 /DNA_ORIENTATION=+